MYFHPLQEEIGNLSDEEISKRIKDLSRKVATARRFGRNPDMLAQLTDALNTYRNAIRERRIEEEIRLDNEIYLDAEGDDELEL